MLTDTKNKSYENQNKVAHRGKALSTFLTLSFLPASRTGGMKEKCSVGRAQRAPWRKRRGGGCKVEVPKERRGRTSVVGTGTKEKAQTAEMPGENRLGWRLPCFILTVSVIDHKAWKPVCKEAWEM